MTIAYADWEDRFLPDILVPVQFFGANTPELTPEKHLLLCIFMVAWEDVQRLTPLTPLHKREELRDWFFGTGDGPCSYQTIMQVLGWEGWIRKMREAVACTSLAPARITRGKRVLTPVCPNGHRMIEDNLVRTKFGRQCMTCYTVKHPDYVRTSIKVK